MINLKAPLGQLNLFETSDIGLSFVPTDEPLDESTLLEKHTDYPPLEQGLKCWLFRQRGSKKLTTQKGYANFDEVLSAVLYALVSLSTAKSKKQRDTDITVWIGDPDFLLIGIPADTPKALVNHFDDRLTAIRGYERTERAHTSTTPMVPIYRYASGTVIVYDDPDLAGQVFVDDGDGYGTGIPLHYRQMGIPPQELE